MKDDQKIVTLKGPDRVRKRPNVVFGSNDREGVQEAVSGLLLIFAAEAEAGNCTALTVKQTGEQLEISCDDRGLYLGQDRQDDIVWQDRLCMLFPAPRSMEEYSFGLTYGSDEILFSGEYSGRENNFGSLHLAATQCASAYMDVTVVRDDIKSTLHFKKGYNEGGLHKEPSQEKTGTTIRFALDKEVFTQTVLPANDLKSQLKKLALVIPGLRCTYIGEKEQVEFCYGSIREYLQEKSDLPVFYTSLEATGRDRYNRPEYTARVTLAVGLCRESEHLCIHNFRELSRYGTHYTALLKRLKREFPEHIKPEDLSVVLVTRCGIGVTAWENATYQSIRNVMIRDMTEDAAGKPLSDFLYQHKDQIKKGHR